MLSALGRRALAFVSGLGDYALFTGQSFRAIPQARRPARRILRALYEQGAVCLPVILIVGLFTGLVLGLQGYHVLSRFGSEGLLGSLVSLSLVREMAPVLAALMLVGQAGSALAAELGMQRNTEQIVALETMGCRKPRIPGLSQDPRLPRQLSLTGIPLHRGRSLGWRPVGIAPPRS